MKPLLYMQHTLMIETSSISFLMLINQLRDKKTSHFRERSFLFPQNEHK